MKRTIPYTSLHQRCFVSCMREAWLLTAMPLSSILDRETTGLLRRNARYACTFSLASATCVIPSIMASCNSNSRKPDETIFNCSPVISR